MEGRGHLLPGWGDGQTFQCPEDTWDTQTVEQASSTHPTGHDILATFSVPDITQTRTGRCLGKHPPEQTPPGRQPPLPEMATATEAGGSHPTGMHSYLIFFLLGLDLDLIFDLKD